MAEVSSRMLNLDGMSFISIISISTIVGMILILIMLLIVFLISLLLCRNGLDPDNIVIPIYTSITDSLSSLILISIAILILSFFNLKIVLLLFYINYILIYYYIFTCFYYYSQRSLILKL